VACRLVRSRFRSAGEREDDPGHGSCPGLWPAGGWPVIEVDTTTPVKVGPLIAAIRAAAGAPSGGPAR